VVVVKFYADSDSVAEVRINNTTTDLTTVHRSHFDIFIDARSSVLSEPPAIYFNRSGVVVCVYTGFDAFISSNKDAFRAFEKLIRKESIVEVEATREYTIEIDPIHKDGFFPKELRHGER
jgi:hypothetical protein